MLVPVYGVYIRSEGAGVSVTMGLLAILSEEGPSFGLRLRQEFEARTGGIWPLNVGQVYATLGRLERDDLVRQFGGGTEGQRLYAITERGRSALDGWFAEPTLAEHPARDELVIKLVLAARRGVAPAVIQVERKAAVQLLQRYTRLKRDATAPGAEVGWLFLLDSLIFQAEARVRWLDACEERLAHVPPKAPGTAASFDEAAPREVDA